MSQYERLLLIADTEVRRTPALERAAALARAAGAALHIVAFIHDDARGFATKRRRELREQMRRDNLDRCRQKLVVEVTQLRAQGLPATSDVVYAKDLESSVRDYILELKPDLVIKDAERGSRLHRVILRSLDWSLLRGCPAPVLLVRPGPSPLPRRILVAVDLLQGHANAGDLNDEVIRHAIGYAVQFDAALQLAYSLNLQGLRHAESILDSFMSDPAAGDVDDLEDGSDRQLAERHAKMRQRFETLARSHSVPEESAHLLLGPAEDTLPALALAGLADTLVIGAARHDTLDHLLGRTGEAIVEKMPCDVLIVRH